MSPDPKLPSLAPGPAQVYQQDIERGSITPDASQRPVVAELQRLHETLVACWQRPVTLWRRFSERTGLVRSASIEGLYLWGGVGRGKTYLMDLFFHGLPSERKLRMHFHRFMLMVHRRLGEEKGNSDPLVRVAQTLARDVDVLCFDEFFVSDIGDAMILANLLEALFVEGVVLVATSNIVPERLYERGLQRQRFLPAIALLERHCKVLNVDGGIDYRLRSLDKAAVFHYPLGADSEAALDALYTELSRGLHTEQDRELEIQERRLRALRWSEGLVWFDFETLCGGPRSAADYIEIARQYHTVFLSGVPVLRENSDDKARRFITLVDEFYDHGVKLVISAQDSLDRLYQGNDLRFPFARTHSRLLEMQTRGYLGSEHHPD